MAKIKEIDIVQPDFYPAFGCIGPACTDNCCHSWLVTVDKEHYLRYKAVQDPDFQALCARFLARNKKDASTPNNYATMALGPDGRCGFQDEDGGCHIYRVLGPGSLCNTCAIYPRRKNQFLPGVWEYSLNLSCQEAARLACLSGKPVEFQRIRREIDPNDPQDSRQPIMTGSRSGSDPYRQPLRQACLDLMQQRQFPVPERLLNIGLLLRRADRLHREKKQNDITAMAAQLVDQAGQGEFAGEGAYDTFKKLASVFYEETPGVLVHPVWMTTTAWFAALELRQEPRRDYVAYSFEFWETVEGDGKDGLSVPDGAQGAGAGEDARSRWHTVAKGDTLWEIARRYGVELGRIVELNPDIRNPSLIYVGQRVRIS